MNNSYKKENIKPEISVIIPCYNVEKYIKTCLLSVINQTFKNLEIIVIDDGSTDKTKEIIKTFDDKRIKFIETKNFGPSHARNLGIKAANAELIGFVDSDDYIDKNFYEKLYKALIETSADIAMANVIKEKRFYKKYNIKYSEKKEAVALQDKINLAGIPNCCYVVNKLYKKEIINEFIENTFFEDVFWLPEIIKKAKKTVSIPESSYHYRENKNSIVKNKSDKIQIDNYKAKKYIVRFFDENNLYLDKKRKNITKKIYYIKNFPLLKIKDNNKCEIYLLFGFIPVFFKGQKLFGIRNIDGHYVILFFNITIRFKHKNFKIDKRTPFEFGLNREKREEEITVSMTTFKDRIDTVHIAIEQLLSQSLKPDRLILFLSKEEFNENKLPENLIRLKEFGLTIEMVDDDIKSYKKLIYALKKYPNDVIITFDDDIYYEKDAIKNLYEKYLKDKRNIYTQRGVRIYRGYRGFQFYSKSDIYFKIENLISTPSFNNTIIGSGGVLYPPNSLYKDIFDIEKIKTIIPTQDDIYFWAMAVLGGTKIQTVKNFKTPLITIEKSQNKALCKINNNSKGLKGDGALKEILKHYPQIKEKLEDR